MSVLIDIVTRCNSSGLTEAQRQLKTWTAEAVKANDTVGGSFIRAGQRMTETGKTMQAMGGSLTKYVTAPIVAMGVLSVVAAMKQQKAFAVLDLQTRSNTKATQAQTKAVDDWIVSSAQATGIAVSELIPAMGRLEIATKDRTKAEMLMKLAEDMSAGSGKSLSVVAIALSRAYQGTTTSLGRMGIKTFDLVTEHVKATAAMVAASGGTLKLGEATTKVVKVQETWAQLMPKLIKAYGGDAAKAADTTAGRFKRFETGVHELAVSFGSDLLPLVNKALGFFTKLSDKFNTMSPGTRKLIEELAGVAAVLGPLLLVAGTFGRALGGMSTGLGIVMTASRNLGGGITGLAGAFGMLDVSAGIWIVAIGAVVAAVVVLYLKCGWFRDAVKAVFTVVADTFKWLAKVAGDAFDWIKDHIRIFIDIAMVMAAPVVIAAGLIIKHFGTIKQIVGDVIDFISTHWHAVWNDILKWTPIGAIVDLIKGLVSEISKHWNGIVGVIDDVLNVIDHVLNSAFGWIPGWSNLKTTFGAVLPGVPVVSHDDGGFIPPGVSISVNNTGKPEQVIPPGGSYIGGSVTNTVDHVAGSIGSAVVGAVRDVAGVAHLLGSIVTPPLPHQLSGLVPALLSDVKKAIIGKVTAATPQRGGPVPTASGSPRSGRAATALATAAGYMGVPYVWGGASRAGVDCSGLTMLAYRAAGVDLLHGATVQASEGHPVAPPMPGDLVFFGSPSYSHHVGVSLGGGRMIDAAHTGTNVRVDELFSDYWGARSYDNGGYLPTGTSIAVNNTGSPEPVGGAGDTTIAVNIGTVYATNPAQAQASTTAIANQIIAKLAKAKRNTSRGRA